MLQSPPISHYYLSPYCMLWKSTDYTLQFNGVRNEGEFHPSVTLEIMVFLVGKFLELFHFLKSLGRSIVEK